MTTADARDRVRDRMDRWPPLQSAPGLRRPRRTSGTDTRKSACPTLTARHRERHTHITHTDRSDHSSRSKSFGRSLSFSQPNDPNGSNGSNTRTVENSEFPNKNGDASPDQGIDSTSGSVIQPKTYCGRITTARRGVCMVAVGRVGRHQCLYGSGGAGGVTECGSRESSSGSRSLLCHLSQPADESVRSRARRSRRRAPERGWSDLGGRGPQAPDACDAASGHAATG